MNRLLPKATPVALLSLALLFGGAAAPARAAEPDEPPPGLEPVSAAAWSERHVRRVLHAFANGSQASDARIAAWARMAPEQAVAEMLNFQPVHLGLSPTGEGYPGVGRCRSLRALMDFWSSDDPANPMRVANRPWYATLAQEQAIASPLHLYLAWTRVMHSPGCNAFLHKTALYLTNYHAAISVQNSGPTLMRAYYDDTVDALVNGADFVALMTGAAAHAALARAYGHMDNRFDMRGDFQGNDDFAREYFQLLFGIQGVTEDPLYHENVTIEHNAWLLTGMALDAVPYAWDSEFLLDWLVAPIEFSNHFDDAGRLILNRSRHHGARFGGSSCLEILRADICGGTALEKLEALGPVAAAHPESLAATPLKFIRFFADDRIDPEEAADLRQAWLEADFDLLAFLRAYAASTRFHGPGAVKVRNAFDRNLLIHNLNQLDAEQFDAELFFEGPILRMFEQGALVFAPTRDVFGGQTGADVANDRFAFKQAWDANVTNPAFLARPEATYQPAPGRMPVTWRRDWGAVIPADSQGSYTVAAVADWLWARFVNDGGAHFDPVARAQVHALLATGYDLGLLLEEEDPARVYTLEDATGGEAALASAVLGAMVMDLDSAAGNERVGLAVNFITALPWTFAMEGSP